MNKTEDTVTITKKLYNTLLRNSRILQALNEGGVDSWEGYEASLKNYDVEVSDA